MEIIYSTELWKIIFLFLSIWMTIFNSMVYSRGQFVYARWIILQAIGLTGFIYLQWLS